MSLYEHYMHERCGASTTTYIQTTDRSFYEKKKVMRGILRSIRNFSVKSMIVMYKESNVNL